MRQKCTSFVHGSTVVLGRPDELLMASAHAILREIAHFSKHSLHPVNRNTAGPLQWGWKHQVLLDQECKLRRACGSSHRRARPPLKLRSGWYEFLRLALLLHSQVRGEECYESVLDESKVESGTEVRAGCAATCYGHDGQEVAKRIEKGMNDAQAAVTAKLEDGKIAAEDS